MDFVFGYLGVPDVFWDEVQKTVQKRVSKEIHIIGVPLKNSEHDFCETHISRLMEKFKTTLQKMYECGRSSTDISLAIICINGDIEKTELAKHALFPSTLIIQRNWESTGENASQRNQSKNQLINTLFDSSITARATLRTLVRELTEKRNKTPLLLPYKNFRSKQFADFLWNLQLTLTEQVTGIIDGNSILKKAIKSFEDNYPKKTSDSKKRPFFVDDSGTEYHSPGSSLHGIPRVGREKHLNSCNFNGFRRLGAPYNPAFHYDCTKNGGALEGNFYNCHSSTPERVIGDPHINIAPNDHYRV